VEVDITEKQPQVTRAGMIVYILCLDESGSMNTANRFQDMTAAYLSFLNGLVEGEDDGVDKRVVVISFDNSARYLCGPEPVTIDLAPKILTCKGGGTSFYDPMVKVGEVMALPSCSQAAFNVLFMTDGDSGDHLDPQPLIESYVQHYGPRFVLNSIAFGTGVSTTALISLTAGGGIARAAATGKDLIDVFDAIGTESKIATSPVWLWFEKKGTPEQCWKYTSDGYLENQLEGYVLDSEYENLVARAKNGSANQQWTIGKDRTIISNNQHALAAAAPSPPPAPATPPAASVRSKNQKSKKGKTKADDVTTTTTTVTSTKPLVSLNNSEKEELMKQLQEIEIQVSASDKSAQMMVILDAVSSLSSLLVNHQREVLSGVTMTVKGAFKSVMMRKLDPDLLNGVCQCISAGFDVYKHYTSDKQFQMIQQIKCPRLLSDPLYVTYEQLVLTSQAMETVSGNWLLSVNYISHLFKSAHMALRLFPHDQIRSIHLLTACVRGDGCVYGINKLLRKATKNQTPSKQLKNNITTTILDAESLTDILRQVVMEGMGEMLESVEKFALNEMKECLKMISEMTMTMTMTSSNLDMIYKEEILTSLKYLIHTFKSLQSCQESFEKCLQKVLKHLKGALKLIDTLSHYLKIFHVTIKPKEVEQRIHQILSSCPSDSLSFVPALRVLLHPTSSPSSASSASSSSKLPAPVKDEVDQLVVMIALMRKIFIESEKSLKQISNSFSKFSFATSIAILESFMTYKERESSSSFVSRQIGRFSSKPSNPTPYLQALAQSLPEFINTALAAQSVLQSKCSFFRFGIEIASKVEDLFFLTSQFSFQQLKELQVLQENVEEIIEKNVMGPVCHLMNELKSCFEADLCGTGWWNSISEIWKVCSFHDAMGAMRQALPTLIGPGQFPERVEESALISILELETTADQLWQSCVGQTKIYGSEGGKKGGQQSLDELKRLVEEMRVTISQAKASSANDSVRRLLKQEKHREKVKYAVQETWQVIEDEILLTHKAAFYHQECLREKVRKCRDDGELSKMTGFIDTVHHAIHENQSVERIEVTQEACEELLTGQSGVSGLGRGLLMQLSHLKRQMELSIDEVTEILITEDPRWGFDYNFGSQQTQDLSLGLSCQRYTRIIPVYVPRSQYYAPTGNNSYHTHNTQHLPPSVQNNGGGGGGGGNSWGGNDVPVGGGTCATCGSERCASCGGTSNPQSSQDNSPRVLRPPRQNASQRVRPASARMSRTLPSRPSSAGGVQTAWPTMTSDDTGGRSPDSSFNRRENTTFGNANRFRSPQRQVTHPTPLVSPSVTQL
jgi:hypothetical protein